MVNLSSAFTRDSVIIARPERGKTICVQVDWSSATVTIRPGLHVPSGMSQWLTRPLRTIWPSSAENARMKHSRAIVFVVCAIAFSLARAVEPMTALPAEPASGTLVRSARCAVERSSRPRCRVLVGNVAPTRVSEISGRRSSHVVTVDGPQSPRVVPGLPGQSWDIAAGCRVHGHRGDGL